MRLSYHYTKLLALLLTAFSFSYSFAYDYPVVGEYNATYEKIFSEIKSGKCDSMGDSLKALEENEGVSGKIYMSICYFEKKQNDNAFKVIDQMLNAQEYDEALYVVQAQMDNGNSDSRLAKYRGLAYYNVGALEPALVDLEAYLDVTVDEEVVYVITDIYISLNRFTAASSAIEKSPVKNGDYIYRKGRIALRKGNVNTALKQLRSITPADEKVYPSSKMLIAEICAGTKRFNCAEKEYGIAAESEEYSQTAKDKLAKLDDAKKLFNGFISIGTQYDSNVTSIDEDELSGSSEYSSARLYGLADVKVNFYPSFAESISVGMTHYGTSNENIHDYDMSNHKIYFQMKKAYDSFELTMPKITADVTYFGGEKYSTSVSGEISATYKMDSWAFTVPLKVAKKNFTGDEETPTISKDGYKYEGALIVSKKFLGTYTARVKMGLAHDDVDGELKVKNDKTLGASVSGRFFKKIVPTISVDYANYDYANTNRNDDYVSVGLKATYIYTENIFFGAGVTYTKTDSNEDSYDYDKTVTDLSVSYTF